MEFLRTTTASARRVPTTPGARLMEALAPASPTFRLTPRPYQYEAVAALLAATARGLHRPLLVLPTGTGKTIVFALLVQRRHGRSLILAHRDELIQQAVDKLRLVDPTLALGVVQAARDEHTAPTVVASVQTRGGQKGEPPCRDRCGDHLREAHYISLLSASALVEEVNESLTAAKPYDALAASFPPQTGEAALHDLLNNMRDNTPMSPWGHHEI